MYTVSLSFPEKRKTDELNFKCFINKIDTLNRLFSELMLF